MKLIYRHGDLRVLRDGWRTIHIFFNRRLSVMCGRSGQWRTPCLRCGKMTLGRTMEFYAGPFVLAFVGQEALVRPSWRNWFGPTMYHELAILERRLAAIREST